MNNFIQQASQIAYLFQNNLFYLLLFIFSFWLIHFINWLSHYRLNILGIYPRNIMGLPGIVCSPFLHADFNHLFFNSIPLFILAGLVALNGWHVFYFVSISIILLAGILVWLFGRKAIHIGASGLVMGYWSYLLIQAYYQPTFTTIILTAVLLYYLGIGLVLNLLPRERSSWESHVFGFIAGIITAYIFV